MTKDMQIDEKFVVKLNEHTKRLFAVKHALNALLYYFENEEYNFTRVELLCIGIVLREYFIDTCEKFEELQKDMGTLL